MQKIYAFRVSLMNGTVTANTHVEACASRELAEQVKEAVRLANVNNDTLGGLRLHFSDIEELTLWESADEVPVLKEQKGARETPPANVDKSIMIEYPVPIGQDEVDFLKGLVRKHKDSVWPARAMHKEWTSKYGHRYGKAVQAMDVHVAPLDGGRTRVSFLAPFWDTKVEDGV